MTMRLAPWAAVCLAVVALDSAWAEPVPVPGIKPPVPAATPHRHLPHLRSPTPPLAGAPALIPLPAPPSTDDLRHSFQRDLLRSHIDDLRWRDATGGLDPLGQRELMNREQELHRLDVENR